MSFEDYANHVSQKLKLALSMAIIRSVPENLTTDEYIDQLKSNILDKKDTDSEISVCSDDFELDDSNSDHNPMNNNNISDNNNNPDNNPINNTNLSNNFNNVLMNNTEGDNINNHFVNNCIRDNEIDTQALSILRNEDNNTNFEINDRENEFDVINEEENDIFNTGDNISLDNNEYDSLIDEVLQLDESQTILNDVCGNDIENTGKINSNRENINITYSGNKKEMTAQDISNATQTLDSNDETYYQRIKDTSTEKTTKIYQEVLNSYTKKITTDSCTIIDDKNTKMSNLKHDNKIEDEPSPKRRKNLDAKLQTDKQIKDPNSRIKNNISKFLDKNNIASKTKVNTDNVKVKDSLETVSRKLNQNNAECTQTNAYYSQSQPLLVIDQKYIYEKSKSIPKIKNNPNLDTVITKKDLNISTNDTKATNITIRNIHNNITDKNSIAEDTTPETELEAPNYNTNTMKIIENDTAFHYEREIYLFSQTSACDVRNQNKLTQDINNDNRNYSNNIMNATTNEENHNNNKEQGNEEKYNNNSKTEIEMESTIYLTQELSPPINNENSYQNNNNCNNNDIAQSSINSIGVQFSPIYHNNNRNADISDRNNNNKPTQSTVDVFSQQFQQNNNNGNGDNNIYKIIDNDNRSNKDNNHRNNNNNRNRNNNNRNINNKNENDISETTKSTIDLFSQQSNNNRNEANNRVRNNKNNEITKTQNTFNNLVVENLNKNEEVGNQSRNSESDLTDSDDVQTEELIPFKIVEELNKVKVYLNNIERGTDSSSDTGYRSDSQSRRSSKMSQSNVWLNQSGHCLFTYITNCQLISNTEEITGDISVVLAQLIQKLYEEETYLSFMEEILDTVDSLLHLVLDEDSENDFLKKDETMQRILLLNKSIHIQKYTIEKITHILENIHTDITTKDTLYETENIQKIENSCYIFHILHIVLQRYYKNQEKLTKKQDNSQKSQYNSQKSQYNGQKSKFDNQKSKFDTQKSKFDSQRSQFDSQKSTFDSQESPLDSQKSQFSSLNSQEVLKKTDISDIWRKKWNPNFKEERNEENVEKKCSLTDCSRVLNKLIVSCMDGYSLIAYFALKCFNLMQI